MPIFTKESLENLKGKIDLVDALSPFVKWIRSGNSYKALCPFHDEKTPSFIVQRKDSHYHCFGCGAHGDAISFLMNHEKMGFVDAVEFLAEKFSVILEYAEKEERNKEFDRRRLIDIMAKAERFYHFHLLHSLEARTALEYLFSRGIDLAFIQKFSLGFAPIDGTLFQKVMHEYKIKTKELEEVGLIRLSDVGKPKDFFLDRIMIPIKNSLGAPIGFSARKYKEETFGGKYINSPDSFLFKKKKILFGLNFTKREIVKKKSAIIVEGQFDAMRLIEEGFNTTVASQGTAFGEEHVEELLSLGVNRVYLALDSDIAGENAKEKIGDLFIKKAVDVMVVMLPDGKDPDSFLREEGPKQWQLLLDRSLDYVTFLVQKLSKSIDPSTPAKKNELIQNLMSRIKDWNHPVLIHESLKKVALLTNTPESILELKNEKREVFDIKSSFTIDADRILEMDLLRFLIILGQEEPKYFSIAKKNIKEEDLKNETCKKLFFRLVDESKEKDILSLAMSLREDEEQLFLSELLQKKLPKEKAMERFLETVQKILDRTWMNKREKIKELIESGTLEEEKVLALVKEFDGIKKERPKIKL